MRLERLEINGFKSFSDRSELAFDKGVTAIVGPNGCGKSNVADAITWVMGEQSAKSLRGDKMEDVIFSGSDARKPTAAAEVRLRFSGVVKQVMAAVAAAEEVAGPEVVDEVAEQEAGSGFSQTDGADNANREQFVSSRIPPLTPAEELIRTVAREVEVTRRLYRSGESEYLIDGQICRLRDIHDLLMDTGLGAKAYAIIEQGKIGMILSTRPTDRRQLIEEAAGVTKYKARRRAAELKLEAAQQNLTRIDDIVFEVEKQRGTLKRQAAKARRYQKLRDELRRWEKVLFARKYRQLADTIESARTRLADAREREAAAAARVAEVESDLGRVRIELVEAETQATRTREAAHARELAINRRQQQIAFDKEQIDALSARTAVVGAELQAIEARREPARAALAERRDAAASANLERDRAADTLAADSEAYETAAREIEGLEADVEAARSEVFSAINAATALRHSLEHAEHARDRVLETLSKLQVEIEDARIEGDRAAHDRATAADGLRRAQEAIEATRVARAARESELASARIEHEWRSRALRSREQELARLEARLTSLEELEAARLEYSDAARAVLAQANGKVNQRGAVADYLEVEAGYERAVEACLGDLLQHVIVDQPEHAAAGFEMVKEQQAGRCGFLIASEVDSTPADLLHTVGADLAEREAAASLAPPDGVIAMSSVLRVNGPFAGAIRKAIGPAWIATSYERAANVSRQAPFVVGTTGGDLFRGPHLVAGGSPVESRGILETKRDIKELRARIAAERDALSRLAEETTALEATIANASAAVAALNADHHRHEKAVVALDAQLQRAAEDAAKVAQKADQLARERRQAEDERDSLQRRQEEAREAIERLDREQRLADERLTAAQRRLFEAREATQDLSHRAAEAKAAHAALVERAAGLAAEVQRLEEAGAELEARAATLLRELDEARRRIDELRAGVAAGEQQLDEDVRALETLRGDVVAADEAVSGLRIKADGLEATIKEARGALDRVRAAVSELEIARATAESDLTHLANTCLDAVQATLDEVLVEVAALEAQGAVTPDARAIEAEGGDEDAEDAPSRVGSDESVAVAGQESEVGGEAIAASADVPPTSAPRTMTAEEAIAKLRAKIDRLGPVNMMAIEQFDELETRHAFLVTQRKDLVDSIAQTSEAIRRIDETTRQRFVEAFAAINRNFQEIFNTLFGGGRAALTLLDESDPLESGIEIVAQPPGKRLQSVQLLSGGEKALTAISLMFGLFKYKPSPFCLLDEIDAPLDDANVGRFVEMLRSMQQHTQFILITHNRKTMEIADRLYGVTMEEPGVSKLISVQLN
ncbi:MAG TPA: chromosome segregation protein SMC [Vicinamibacterales bacterium]